MQAPCTFSGRTHICTKSHFFVILLVNSLSQTFSNADNLLKKKRQKPKKNEHRISKNYAVLVAFEHFFQFSQELSLSRFIPCFNLNTAPAKVFSRPSLA